VAFQEFEYLLQRIDLGMGRRAPDIDAIPPVFRTLLSHSASPRFPSAQSASAAQIPCKGSEKLWQTRMISKAEAEIGPAPHGMSGVERQTRLPNFRHMEYPAPRHAHSFL